MILKGRIPFLKSPNFLFLYWVGWLLGFCLDADEAVSAIFDPPGHLVVKLGSILVVH